MTLDKDHGSDHLAVETILDLRLCDPSPAKLPYNYNNTNWELLKITLTAAIPAIIDVESVTEQVLDGFVRELVEAHTSVPLKNRLLGSIPAPTANDSGTTISQNIDDI